MKFISVFVAMLVCAGFNLSFCQAGNVSGNLVRFPFISVTFYRRGPKHVVLFHVVA